MQDDGRATCRASVGLHSPLTSTLPPGVNSLGCGWHPTSDSDSFLLALDSKIFHIQGKPKVCTTSNP